MKFNALRSNFSSGHWSEKMLSRTDTEQYKNACTVLKNFIPLLHGGAMKRPGTESVIPTGPLVTQNYVGAPRKMLVASIVDADNDIDEWLMAFNGNGTLPGPYAIRLTDNVHRAIAPGTSINVLVDGSFTPTGEEHYSSVGNYVIIVFPDGKKEPRVITRIRKTNTGTTPSDARNFEMYRWSDFCNLVETSGFIYDVFQKEWNGYPFLPRQLNNTAGTITVAGAASTVGGVVTLTASNAIFKASHVRSLWKLGSSTVSIREGVVRITSVTSATVATGVVLSTLPPTASVTVYGGNATTWWAESAWNDYRGWPRSLTNYQGRLIFGGSPDQPNAIWGSKIGAPFFFFEQPFIQDDSTGIYLSDNSRSFTLYPDTSEAADIVGVTGFSNLIINTDKFEIVARGTQGALGPLDAEFKSTTSYGASQCQPVKVGSTIIYVQATEKTIREVIYNFDSDQFVSPDLGFLSDDLIYENIPNISLAALQQYRIRQFAYMREPSILWCLLTDGNNFSGKIVALHLDREYKFNAWFEIELTELPNSVISIACSRDTLFMGVNSPGDTWGPIVKMGKIHEMHTADEMQVSFTDRLLNVSLDNMRGSTDAVDGVRTTFTISSDYAGQTVSVMADRKYVGDFPVVLSGGLYTVTLPNPPQLDFCVGYKYQADLETMPLELGNQIAESSHARIKRADEVVFSFYRSFGAQYGKSFDELFDLDFLDYGSYNQQNNLPLFSGQIVRSLDFGYDRQYSICVRSDSPYPCMLLSITARGVTYD